MKQQSFSLLSVKGGPVWMHILLATHIPKVKILTAIQKKQESDRNKYYKSLWIKYICRIITNKISMPKNKTKQGSVDKTACQT